MMKVLLTLILSFFVLSCSSWTQTQYNEGQEINGFTLEKVEEVPEIEGKAYFFVHKKTKAPLLYLSNGDKNKTFGIAFKTPPKDSTGVFHIFEHSVLAGSRKYPSKSLFFQVAGSSVNTFQNAMTYNDKTFYPVASTNAQDFENLVDIYLDSVFYPQVLHNEKIFKREGWRYEVNGDEISYNGIVFSEMKGAFANPERFLWRQTLQSLFSKESPYHHESGGDILHIPDLTFEQLTEAHQKYYHPSNSYIFFYGDGRISKHLAIVNNEYLSRFEQRKSQIEIPVVGPIRNKKLNIVRSTYPIDSSQGNSKNKTMHARSFVIEPLIPNRDYFGLQVLLAALSEFEESPLKRRLTMKGICHEVEADLDLIKQPLFGIYCKGSTNKKMQLFSRTIDATLKEIAQKGLPKDLIESAVNKVEFQLREFSSIHRGLTLANRVLESWLYNGPALEYVRYAAEMEWIRSHASSDWFLQLLNKYIISNGHQSLVSISPDTKMMGRIEKQLQAQLGQAKKKIGLKALKAEAQEFTAWNSAPVPVEEQRKVPVLKVSDLNREAKIIPQEVTQFEGTTILSHPLMAQGIVYASFYFDVHSIPEKWVPYLPLLAESLGKVRTNRRSFEEIDLKIYKESGGITSTVSVFPHKGRPDLYDARFVVQIKALQPKLDEALALLKEVVLETRFDSTSRMSEIFRNFYSQQESSLGRQAVYFSLLNTRAKIHLSGRYNNALNGMPQLTFLREHNKKKNFTSLNQELQKISNAIFQKHNLIIGLGYDPQSEAIVRQKVQNLVKSLPEQKSPPQQNLTFSKQMLFDGAAFSGQVQFMSIFSQSPKVAEQFGGLKALSQLISVQFIYPQIREQGGAYGGGMIVSEAGELGFYTYRDPRLDESYQDFLRVPQFLRTYANDQVSINSAILATIGDMDLPLTAQQQVARGVTYFLQKLTPQDLQKFRDQVFALNVKDLKAYAQQIETGLKNAELSVVGYRPTLESSKLLKNIVNL